ncbi:glycine dehydrogenase [Pseudomonas monteilii]|uniref:Glycine dehydrogenase n=1 Tax=Pseudomonas monteilii TaxID=76759 RepID=A0AAE6REH8_9PSED|nr:glycine dehydrogenase [Pseudomonas monteilii]
MRIGREKKLAMNPARARPGSDQHYPHQHGDDHRQFGNALRVSHGQRRHGTGDHRAGSGVRANHQLARAADQGIDHHWQHAGVQAVLWRQTDNLCVSDGDGYLNRRDREACLQIGMEPFAAVVQQVGKAR